LILFHKKKILHLSAPGIDFLFPATAKNGTITKSCLSEIKI